MIIAINMDESRLSTIGPFFAVTSGLLVVMAVVYVGHGVVALQEAGAAESAEVNFIAFGVLVSRRKARSLSAATAKSTSGRADLA